MKRMRFLLGCAACVLAFLAAGCSDGGGSGSAPQNAVEFPKYSAGKIIKNKVVSLSDGDSGYCEYLEFTSETAGEYNLSGCGIDHEHLFFSQQISLCPVNS